MGKKHDDNQTQRLLRLIMMLKSRPHRMKELVATLGVCARTVYRDIEDLTRVGAVVTRSDRGYSMDPEVFMRPLALTEGELQALYLATRFLERHGAGLSDDVASAMLKIRAGVRSGRSTLEGTLGVAGLDPAEEAAATPASNLLETTLTAMRERRRMMLFYHSLSRPEPVWRKVDPLGVFFLNVAWYLVAHDHLSGERRTFRLNRVQHFEVLAEGFTPPEHFEVEDSIFHNFDAGIGTPVLVRLRVGEGTRRYLEENPGHSTQEISGDEVHMRVKAPERMVRWILGLTEVEVLEPGSLRDAVARAAAEVGARNSPGLAASAAPRSKRAK